MLQLIPRNLCVFCEGAESSKIFIVGRGIELMKSLINDLLIEFYDFQEEIKRIVKEMLHGLAYILCGRNRP